MELHDPDVRRVREPDADDRIDIGGGKGESPVQSTAAASREGDADADARAPANHPGAPILDCEVDRARQVLAQRGDLRGDALLMRAHIGGRSGGRWSSD